MNGGSLVPIVAMVGGATLLYLGLRRDRKRKQSNGNSPSFVCDLRSQAPCGPNGECIPLYDEGQAPVGFENAGMCFQGAP